jgi:hypothetical protein
VPGKYGFAVLKPTTAPEYGGKAEPYRRRSCFPFRGTTTATAAAGEKTNYGGFSFGGLSGNPPWGYGGHYGVPERVRSASGIGPQGSAALGPGLRQ